jgi:hypothetical protein
VRRGVRAVKVLLFVLSWSHYLPSGASHNSLIPSSSCGCRLDEALDQITSKLESPAHTRRDDR